MKSTPSSWFLYANSELTYIDFALPIVENLLRSITTVRDKMEGGSVSNMSQFQLALPLAWSKDINPKTSMLPFHQFSAATRKQMVSPVKLSDTTATRSTDDAEGPGPK